jgi:hypothetical protein
VITTKFSPSLAATTTRADVYSHDNAINFSHCFTTGPQKMPITNASLRMQATDATKKNCFTKTKAPGVDTGELRILDANRCFNSHSPNEAT